jgi:hypothetical protein
MHIITEVLSLIHRSIYSVFAGIIGDRHSYENGQKMTAETGNNLSSIVQVTTTEHCEFTFLGWTWRQKGALADGRWQMANGWAWNVDTT